MKSKKSALRTRPDGLFRLSAIAAVAASSFTALPAAAQEAAKAEETAAQLDTIEVTGSRLPQPSLTSATPLSVISEREVDFQGTVNIESLINNLPQAFAEFSSNDSNGATGTATVSLRGLGSERTLVLIDGRRLMPGDPFATVPDLNFIPAQLVESIEIMTGGASAVYGSDAVAGVVNFKMKRDFEGLQFDSQFSRTSQGDGMVRDYTMLFGTNFADKKGNVTFYANYTKQDEITQNQRDFSACSVTTPRTGDRHNCAGSRTIAEGLIYSYDRSAAGLDYYAIVNPNGTRSFIADDGRTFNFAPFNFFQRPTERYSFGAFGHVELNEHAEVYGNAMFMDSRSVAAVAPSGLFFVSAQIPCNSPLLSADQKQFLCTDVGLTDAQSANTLVAKRAVEVGPRLNDLRHTDYRINLGVKGKIIDGLDYDLSTQRGEIIYSAGQLNYINTANAIDALNTAVDGNGNAVCASGNAGCVPLDLFQLGALTPDQIAYIRATGYEQASLLQEVTTGVVTADLGVYGLTIPSALSGVKVALGAEYRSESLDYRPDINVETGNLGGFGGPRPAVAGDFSVKELFTEVSVPLVEGKTGAELLQFEAALRVADYSTAGNADASTLRLTWAPVKDVTLRGSYAKATRAPNIIELFAPQSLGLFSGADPCAGANLQGNPNAPTQQQCANTGVTADQYNAGVTGTTVNGSAPIADCSSGQCVGLFGGNPDLDVEEATTKSVGIVFTPTFAKDLSITVDFFDIEVEDSITTLSPGVILQQCLLTGNADFCNAVNRGPTGRLFGDSSNPNAGFVTSTNQNIGGLATQGIDVAANYALKMGDMGRVSFNYVTTYLEALEVNVGPGLGTYDCAGLYGTTCGTPSPRYRHQFRTTWEMPFGLAVSANWRYFGSTKLDANTSDPNLSDGDGRFNAIDNELKEKHYLDLAATYLLPLEKQRVSVRFGVNNATNTEPQIVSSNNPNPVSGPPFGNGNTFPNVYDPLGTTFFVGLTADF